MMKLLLALGSTALLLLGTAAPVRAAKADTTPPKLEAVEFSRKQITVDGLEVKLLTVTAHITDETGVEELDLVERGRWPYIGTRAGGANLTLGRGTAKDGWWTGGIPVTSSWSGDYKPTGFGAIDQAGNEASVADVSTLGIDLPTVAVTSTDRPTVQLLITPNPANVGDRINRAVKVTHANGQAWPGVPVQMRYDNECVEYFTSVPDGRTNSSGVFTIAPLPAGQTHDFLICGRITSEFNVPEQNPTFIVGTSSFITYRYKIAANPAATSAPAGSNVAVTGNLVPGQQGKELQLQRLYAPGDWRTVNRTRTTPASRFTVSATPPGTSLYSYRVFAPAEQNRAAAVSNVFTIRGT